MILTHKAKRCKLEYTTTQQFLSQTPLPHELITDYTLTLNISIHLCSKDLQPFLCRGLNSTQRKDGASKTSPTCYTRLHCHTQTHTRGHRRCIPLKPSGIAPSHCINREDSLWKTQTPFCPRITIWMHGNLHHYTQLSEHRDSYSHTKAWTWILMLLKKLHWHSSFREVYSTFLEWPATWGMAPPYWAWILSRSWGSLNAKASLPFSTLNLFLFKVGVFVQVYQGSRWAPILMCIEIMKKWVVFSWYLLLYI